MPPAHPTPEHVRRLLEHPTVDASKLGDRLVDVVDIDEHLKPRARTDLHTDQLLG